MSTESFTKQIIVKPNDKQILWLLGVSTMTIEEIRANAPEGATHYFLVPNGSGDPYYVIEENNEFFYFYAGDKIHKENILSWIKPLH